MLRTTTTVIALAALTTAQLLGSLSTQCLSAFTGIANDQDASACLSPSDLVPLVISSGNTSIVGPIDAWVNHVCAAAPCSNSTLEAVVRNITSGCQAELGGESSAVSSAILPAIQQYYPTVRKVVCLKDNGTNCITETLTDLERVTGRLTINGIMSMLSGSGFSTLPRNFTCTDCIKASLNTIAADVPSIVEDARPALQSQCGASFVDGNTPSGISQSAVDSASGNSNTSNNSNNTNGASALLTSGLAASGLIIVSTIVTLL